jgi:hypothetical protein
MTVPRLCVLLLTLLFAAPSFAAQVHDYASFLNELVNLDGLPQVQEGVTCAQASSYDRAARYDAETDQYVNWGANGDAGQYIRVDAETKEGVMAELEGPGCIFRIWSANPQGVIRFYLDGDTKPTYQFDFSKLFSGDIEPFIRPLVWQRRLVLGGDNPASDCYVPIPFAKSCRVTSVILNEEGTPTATPGHYYHIGYKLYPKDWKVETFHLPLTAEQKAKLDEVAKLWNNCGEDPQPARDASEELVTITVKPGATQTIFDLAGPATIRQFHAKLKSDDPYATRNVVLRAFWDGEKQPSVLTPFGDFFGRAVGDKEYRSLPLGMTADQGSDSQADYCYWRMPFLKHGTLTVENQGTRDATIECRFVYATGRVPTNTAYFHAKWRREALSATFDYPFVECTGAGTFVGDLLAVDNLVGGWWGEGDEKFFVNGEKFPSTFGTGSEDYYGDAWGIRWFVNPSHGCPQNEGRKQVVYRWHMSDSVPFSTSFKATIENYSAFDAQRHNGYASVAYWYQVPGGDDFFPKELPAPDKRRPTPKIVISGVLEAEDVLAKGAEADIIDTYELRDTYSAGRAVVSKGPELKLAVPVETADVYTIALYEAPEKPVLDGKCTVFLDDKPVGPKTYLEPGTYNFTVRLAPERSDTITLDYIRLVPYRNFITQWLVLGPFDNAGDAGYETVYPPEEKLDFAAEYDVKGGKAKWVSLAAGPDGYVNFDAFFRPNDDVVSYAYAEIISPDERDADLLIGSDDGAKAWLNGRLVHDHHVHRGWIPDQDREKVRLSKGTNTLLIKVDEGGGAWGFSARFVDPHETLQYKVPAQ